MEGNRLVFLIGVLILGLGIFGAGERVGRGIYIGKKMSRSVSVKGLAEQDVKSDLGMWDINYREIGNDLVQLNQRLAHDQEAVSNFLKSRGFDQAEMSATPLKVEDRLANIYNQPSTQNATDQRYVVTGGVRVRSTKVDLIQKTLQVTDQLLQQGIPLAFDVSMLNPNPSFFFTKLDSIRPQMLADATKSARAVAEQFAIDSNSKLLGIDRASQGVFQIMGRDASAMGNDWNSAGAIEKKVRLVTTIEYRIQ